jgi:glycerophosphoryl diester phosphodiesterase
MFPLPVILVLVADQGTMKATLLGSGLLVAASWSYLRHVQLPVGPSRMHWGEMVFGHRGCRFIPNIPENTLPAFQYALESGAQGVELDVRLSKDNEVVVFHDAYFNKHMKNAEPTKRVDQLDLFEIKQLAFECDPTDEVRIPTLEEIILYCREKQLKMLIEIKELERPRVCVDKVLELYRRYPEFMYKETTVIAFSPSVLYNLRSKDKNVAVGQLYSGEVIHAWVTTGAERAPAVFALAPWFFDKIALFMQSKVNPWVTGVSVVCPKYTLFSPKMRRMWHSRRIAVYCWGFSKPQECDEEMRTKGVMVACDDRHAEFATAKPPPDFDIFGDAARRKEEEANEARRRQQLSR